MSENSKKHEPKAIDPTAGDPNVGEILLRAAASQPEERDAMRKAEDALHSWLANGAVEVKALKKLAEEADIGWRTLERAKRCLRVKTEKRGGPGNKNGPWMWRLSGEDRQPGALAAFSGERTKSLESDRTASQRRPPAEDRQTSLADFTEGHFESSSSVWDWPGWGSGWD
jgi:hypothetical protein